MARLAKDLADTRPKIMVAFPHPGFVQTDFMNSLFTCAFSGKYDLQLVDGFSGPVISKARNSLTQHFINTPGAEYLLFADTDIVFDDTVLDRLLKADLPIASALYVAPYPRIDELNPVALMRHEDDGLFWPLQVDLSSDGFDPETPIPVDGVGMGLCLIKRQVIEDLGADIDKGWPFAEVDGNGEDLTFCIRAQAKGYQAYVIPAARAGHRKMFTV